MTDDHRPSPSDRGRFDTTRWSLVIAAADSRETGGRQALEELCRIYWPPVYGFIRRRGHAPDAAQDLTQGFFARVLEKRDLKHARRERGRFRSFLLTAVKFYMANEWDREQAIKRGGGRVPLSLDLSDAEQRYLPEPSHDETPERLFEKRWAVTLLERVLERLSVEMEQAGQGQRFRAFKPLLSEGISVSYGELASELEMSESAVKVAVHRLRKRFGAMLREEVRQTLDDETKVDEELRHLFEVMGG